MKVEVKFLWCSIWNPQYFILFLLHDGRDLSANIGDAASLDNACNKGGEGDMHMRSVKYFCQIWLKLCFCICASRAATSDYSHYQFICLF